MTEEWIAPILEMIAANVYLGVFLAALLETIIPPIPSEIVFTLAGYSIRSADMHWIHVIGAGITGGSGATMGADSIFVAAKRLGRPGLLRYMGRLRITEKNLGRAERWFVRHGDKSVILGRCVPGIRELVSVPAGILNMRTPKFLAYTFVGSCAWGTALTIIGYYFGAFTL